MGNYFSLKENDRIVEINNISLFVHDDLRPSRRNVRCYSKMLESYINSNNLSINNIEDKILVQDLLKKGTFNDIKVIGVKGYY